MRASNGAYLDRAVGRVSGHRVTIIARAQLTVTAVPISIDGAAVDARATAALAGAVPVPLTTTVPRDAPGEAVRSVRFDEDGVGVDPHAQDVDAAPGTRTS